MTIAPLDLAPPMLATDLAAGALPTWLRAAAAHRLNTPRLGEWSWHSFARIAISHAKVGPRHQLVYRVLIDWHGATALDCTPNLRDVADEADLPGKAQASHIISDLAAWGWLHVAGKPGKPSTVTLLCPVVDPVDNRNHRTRGVATEATPVLLPKQHPLLPKQHPVATEATHRGTGVPGTTGDARVSARDASDAVPRTRWGDKIVDTPWTREGITFAEHQRRKKRRPS
jgi:hypothetical protein